MDTHRRGRRPRVVADDTIRDVAASLVSRWADLEYLRTASQARVEVSISTDGNLSGTVDEHESIMMPFGSLLDQIMVRSTVWLSRTDSQLHYHLAQCPLTSLPDLNKDTWPPPPCLPASRVHNLTANLWFAIGPTTSGLHYDCYNNLVRVPRRTTSGTC